MKTIKNLFLEKINNNFRSVTQTKQVTGLSVCLDFITQSVPDSIKIVVSDIKQVELAINRFAPKNLILGYNFLNHNELKSLRIRYPFLKIYMIIHSPISFMAADQSGFRSLYEAIDLGCKVIVNDPRFDIGINGVIHLENCYNVNFRERINPIVKDEFNVICSGSVRVLKNHMAQAVAAMIYCDKNNLKLNFHCNLGRSELAAAVITNLKLLFTRNLNHKLISLPWQDHREFVDSLSNYHLGMQVSFTESYNLVSADYINAGLPMVVSHEIRFASDKAKACPNNVREIASKIKEAHLHVDESRVKFVNHNNKAVAMWKKELN